MNYRADIQGLRGFAVLAVLADHFAPDIRQTSGGFVGVDIFFVISGFLITSLIQRELKNHEFTLSKFWIRRIKRIFPSLLIMLTVSSILLWGLSTEYGKGELLKNLIKATTFSSNIGYTATQDYFAGQSQNPLLHLWSLAIEEQFYLVWPLICLLLFKLKRGTTLYFSYLIVFLSFTANLMTVYYFENKSFAFYNTFTRIWELMLGAILAQHLLNQDQQIPKKVRLNHVLAFCGALLVAASLCIITQDSAFPGYLALMPTIGTVAIIAAGPHNFISRYLFGNPLFIWFGGISYSLYLWHFPILFMMRLLHPGSTNFQLLILMFVISILLAFISTIFIEKPFRRAVNRRFAIRSLLSSMVILLVFASATQTIAINKSDPDYILDKYSARGWGNQSDLDCVRLRKEITVRTLKRQDCFESQVNGRETVFLVGDSHSGSLRSGLKPYLKSKGIALRGVSTGWCGWYEIEPLDDDKVCASITQEFLSAISISKPKLLIIDGYWAKMAREVDVETTLLRYIQVVQSLGVEKVIIVGQIPTYEMGLPKTLQVEYLDESSEIPSFIPRDQVVNDPEGIEELMRSIDFPSNVYFRSLDEILCKNNTCRTTVGPNLATDLIVWDYGHVTESGALFLSKIIFKDIEDLISN
ncbi:unannotated protein [freshwater metagenome]|uniref:Unannotated protein n=1 Tax=freshwater metagenome TaxID=449393 RepID=A0A6J7UNU9_9ZZZZ|nr:acyltransferase family protein [Actinomycetota bacterium]